MFTFPKNILLNFALAKPRTLGFTLQELFENLTQRHIRSISLLDSLN